MTLVHEYRIQNVIIFRIKVIFVFSVSLHRRDHLIAERSRFRLLPPLAFDRGSAFVPLFCRYLNKTRQGGRRDDICNHGLYRRSIAEGKTSYELSWKVKVTGKQGKRRNTISPPPVPSVFYCVVRGIKLLFYISDKLSHEENESMSTGQPGYEIYSRVPPCYIYPHDCRRLQDERVDIFSPHLPPWW